jgi:hypothetical protein
MTFKARVQCGVAWWALAATLLTAKLWAQESPHERVFSQPKAAVEKALQTLQPSLSGHLPTLEGFAKAGDRSLDRYERGYYQATVQINAMADGSSLVRATSKVTAWYSDPAGFHSGYQLLTSNGRIEEDLLDQLAEQLARLPEEANRTSPITASKSSADSPASGSVIGSRPHATDTGETSASIPASTPPIAASPSSGSDVSAPSAVSRSQEFALSSNPSLSAAERTGIPSSTNPSVPTGEPSTSQPNTEKTNRALQAEAESLEAVLRNQAHPNNLVAVKKSGTAVVTTPTLSAKALFLASMHDEFELLDFNRDWVHVRISGLSRGWIWRNSVEMPNGIADTVAGNSPAPAAATDLFHVVREETAPFPGDWEPLRGKTVKIFSVQEANEAAKNASPTQRLAYAKFLLDKSYAEITQKTAVEKTQELTGVVLIFDSADGGMIAATLAALQQWKKGTLTDSAMWHKCFFDPPETFDSAGASASQ